MKKIKLSIIICTLNSPKLIKRCLESILKQNFKDKYEILLVDGGSDQKTINLIKNYTKNYSHIKMINNPKKLPEGAGKGKWLGFKKSKGEIFGIIDQDNELIGENSLKNIIKPFENKEIFGVACKLYLKDKDNLTNKAISLMGTDPFVAYRSLDYLINTNKLNLQENKDYSTLKLNVNNIIITGGNCFFYRRGPLKNIGGYIQDIDNLLALVKKGYNKIAIPKQAFTHHQAIEGFLKFIKKKKSWGKEYSPKNREFSWMPKTKLERREFILNLFRILSIFPMFIESWIMAYKKRKLETLFIPIMKLSTLLAYISGRIK